MADSWIMMGYIDGQEMAVRLKKSEVSDKNIYWIKMNFKTAWLMKLVYAIHVLG